MHVCIVCVLACVYRSSCQGLQLYRYRNVKRLRCICGQVLYLYEDFIGEITVDYQNDNCGGVQQWLPRSPEFNTLGLYVLGM